MESLTRMQLEFWIKIVVWYTKPNVAMENKNKLNSENYYDSKQVNNHS